jgi:hypothetical protein
MARLRGVLACLLALTVWGGVSFSARAGSPQSGFAIWPEDNEPAAAAACAGRGEDEAWRTSPERTAEEFTRDELGWTAPSAGDPFESGSQTRLIVYDAEAEGVFLGVVLDLFRYDDCWYVTEAFPREGELSVTKGFTEVDGQTNLLVRMAYWDGIWLDYGFGDEHDVPIESEEQVLFPVEGETDTGHLFVYAEDQPSENVQGETLPAPMDPSLAEPASGRGGYAMWPFHFLSPYSQAKSYCRRPWMHDPERVVKTFVRGEIGSPTQIERQDRAHWLVDVENAHFRMILRHVQKDCWPVARVKSLDRTIDAEVRMEEDSYTIDFEWDDASAADITLNYGGNWDGAFIERVPGPFTEPDTYDTSRPGAYWVVLLDQAGDVVGVEGSKLGPIE